MVFPYPALCMLFGMLQTSRWLDNLKQDEILDICDAAKLDRYRNRIDDVMYLRKHPLDYPTILLHPLHHPLREHARADGFEVAHGVDDRLSALGVHDG